MISIITPTYNRAHLLSRAYESLVNQTNHNFEWIVVDDGSQDQTEEVIGNFDSALFSIKYFKKKNGGKHTALNIGVQEASGDFILMLDSDDYLIDSAIEIIKNYLNDINNNQQFGGVAFRRINAEDEIRGNSTFQEIIATPVEIRQIYNVTGDFVEVFKTNVLKEHPFPEYPNEKFCPEILVWNRIGLLYKIKYINVGIYVSEYLEGGLTDKIINIRMLSPKASMLTYSELTEHDIPFKEKVKANINFWRFSFNDKDWSFMKKLKMINPVLTLVTLPLGFAMHINDKRKVS